MKCLERPTEALVRIAQSCSPSDWEEMKAYLAELERGRALRSNDFPEVQTPGHTRVSEYNFLVPDAAEKDEREFVLTIFKDRSCAWHDTQGRLSEPSSTVRDVKSLNRELNLARDNYCDHEFTLYAKISLKAFRMIVLKQATMAYNGDVAQEDLDAIDRELADTFWSEINPKLPKPLRRVITKRV